MQLSECDGQNVIATVLNTNFIKYIEGYHDVHDK